MKSLEIDIPRGQTILSHAGLISASELSTETGLRIEHIFRELLSNNIPIAYLATNIAGYLIEDFRSIEPETEQDGNPIKNSFVLNDAIAMGSPHTFACSLRPFDFKHSLKQILASGYSEETSFRIPSSKYALAAFDLPGIRLDPSNIIFSRLRYYTLSFSKLVNVELAKPAISTHPVNEQSLPCICCRPEKAKIKCSWLAKNFLEKKSINWKPDERKRMEGLCSTFIELMDDPMLGELDRETIWEYEKLLRKMPADRYQASRRHRTRDAKKLIELAELNSEIRLSDQSVEKYITAMSRMFSWAVDGLILTANPAKGALERGKKRERDQDDRDKFTKEELQAIFSAEWFRTGTGIKNKHGRFHQFRPYYYWLPLLGLYTGARLNELSQLYLTDICEDETGTPYISFNDKTDSDTKAPDKSLKNNNSKRTVPLHPKLIELGLLDYVDELKKQGHTRLFPELKHSDIKGYGKAAGKWFNESFLKSKLKIARDGRKTFHSFRHTLITALYELETPADIQAQISGHSRGESIGARRYRKDAEATRLLVYIERLDFNLPMLKPFVISDGLAAVKDALRRKQYTPPS